MTTVLIAAATAIVRAGLEAVLAGHGTFAVLATTPGVPLGQQVADTQPDVLLIDLDRERLASVLRELSRAPSAPRIVVLTDDPRSVRATGALRGGVQAILPRDASADEIIATIGATATGLVVLHPDALEALRSVQSSDTRLHPRPEDRRLTPRETEVLGMMAEGLGNKIIAARLGISEHTVKFHVAAIFTKLGAGSRTEAVTIGLRRGLILI